MELITMICPIYNSEKYLKELIDSINNQNFKDFKVIFVDDGSKDKSLEVLKQLNKKFKYEIFSQDNLGAPAARNLGIKKIDTPYVYFFDSDDILLPNTLEILSRNMIENDCDIVLGKMMEFETGYINEEKIYEDSLETAMKWTPTPGCHLFKTSIIKENGIKFSHIRIGQDLNFNLKYLSYCKKIKILNDVIYAYRDNPNGISNSHSNKVVDIILCLNEAEKYFVNKEKIFFDLKLTHYYAQFSKFRYISNFKDKWSVYKRIIQEIFFLKPIIVEQRKNKVIVLIKCFIKFIYLFY